MAQRLIKHSDPELTNGNMPENTEFKSQTFLQHFKKEKPTSKSMKHKQRAVSKSPISFQNTLAHSRIYVKPLLQPPCTDKENLIVITKAPNTMTSSLIPDSGVKITRNRSKSSVTTREPWGQLLKNSKENLSLFSNFDPLRTLHFLAKELQFQLQTILPDNVSIQQIVADIQYALKRVPPEVASTVHLQQTIELLPVGKNCHKCEKLSRIKLKTVNSTQTNMTNDENKKLQVIMAENTLKLENSCKNLENLCSQLKNERQHLETELKLEKENALALKKKVETLEYENDVLLNVKLKALEQDKYRDEEKAADLVLKMNKLEVDKTFLEAQIIDLNNKFKMQTTTSSDDMKSHLRDLERKISTTEKECIKLKHNLRLSVIEKEKYLAMLDVRDHQIFEIRNEMDTLQEIINKQLTELHGNAVSNIPNNEHFSESPKEIQKEVIGDTISSVTSNDDEQQYHKLDTNQNSPNELQSGDTDLSLILQERFSNKNKCMNIRVIKKQIDPCRDNAALEPQLTIKQFFDTLKVQTYNFTGDLNL